IRQLGEALRTALAPAASKRSSRKKARASRAPSREGSPVWHADRRSRSGVGRAPRRPARGLLPERAEDCPLSTAPMPWPGAYRVRWAHAWSAAWRVLRPALLAAGLLVWGLRSSEWLAAGGSAAEPPPASRGAPAAREPLSGSPPLPQVAPPSPPPREPTRAPPGGPIVLPARTGGPEVHAFAPRPARAHAVVAVMLHGMCSEPALQCPQLAPAFETWGWLLCPRATLTCSDGDATWK